MPEGHVIHRAARRIAAALATDEIIAVEARGPGMVEAHAAERLTGAHLVEADPRGKHLMLHFDNDLTVHSHLRMDGAWHTYRTGERWRVPRSAVWLVLDTGTWQAVNVNGPILELAATDAMVRDARITRLGPDVLVDPFDDAEYVRRMRSEAWREIGDAVMQQHLVAGIGNIYKNESLFMAGIDPWSTVADLADDDLVRIREIATRIMIDGVLDPRAITFRGPGPAGKWVYGRGDDPCRSCGTTIVSKLQGADQRVTWWCPRCQSITG